MVGSLHSARVLPTRSHHSCIPELEAALSDPSTNVPSTIPQLLADLHTRKDLGVLPPYPTDDASKPEWNAKAKRRSDLHEKYFEQANALLVASIPKRSGPQRPTAIYQAWYDAEVPYRTKPLSPDILSELRFNVLAAENQLTHAQRLQFVVMARQTMPHQLLLPIIRSLASDSGTAGASFDGIEPYKLWCEDAPEGCRSAILADIRSEEHTSELQSRLHLVCRLLLEKKKIFDIILLAHCSVGISF